MNAEEFNVLHPVGTPVFAYPVCRPEDCPNDPRLVTRTRSKAELLGGHTDVVWVDGYSSCIAFTHIDVVSENEWEAAKTAESAAKCRCGEPDADPYACEADDCTGEFPELNPFGGGPVQGHDAKASRTCGCGWTTTVWHVDDGSAEEELHSHTVRVHGGVTPEATS